MPDPVKNKTVILLFNCGIPADTAPPSFKIEAFYSGAILP